MIAVILGSPALTVLAGIGIGHVVWWVVGDFLLEHVGVPFLDGGHTRERVRPSTPAQDRPASAIRRAVHVRRPSERRDPTALAAGYERDKRRTGMSRGVRA